MKVWAVPILHPSYIMRGQWALEPAQVAYLKRALKIAKGWDPPLEDVTACPPGCVLQPTLGDLDDWRTGLEGCADRRVAADLECAGPVLLGVGLMRFEDEVGIYVPFRHHLADTYWRTYKDCGKAAVWLDGVLSDPTIPKVFQNGQAFDVPYLQDIGFEVQGYEDDTMIMQHVAYPEMPKGLEYLGILYAGLPAWKWLAKVADQGDGK